MRRDGERELRARKEHAVALIVREREILLELRQRGDAIFKLPLPVVPLFRRHIRPMPGRV